jgi:hypothetical protein
MARGYERDRLSNCSYLFEYIYSNISWHPGHTDDILPRAFEPCIIGWLHGTCSGPAPPFLACCTRPNGAYLCLVNSYQPESIIHKNGWQLCLWIVRLSLFPFRSWLPRVANLTNSLIMDINSPLKLFELLLFAGLLVREIKAYIRLSKFNGSRLAAFLRCQPEFGVIYCPNWRCQ